MGYQRHHAIIVTSYNNVHILRAQMAAKDIFGEFPMRSESKINEYYTFLIPPDGSKEDWPESDAGDVRRDKFINWLNEQRFEDGSSPYKWVEVQYGDDEDENIVTRAESDGRE